MAKGARSDQKDIAGLTASAIDQSGNADFYDRLLDLLGAIVPHDPAAMVRYSRAAPPDLILHRIEPTAAMLAYYHHLYVFDPFYTFWVKGAAIGVYRLRAMDNGIGRSRYAREFLTEMAIHDEVAVFLPPVRDASPTLILDRARGVFYGCRNGPGAAVVDAGRIGGVMPLDAMMAGSKISIDIWPAGLLSSSQFKG